MIVVDFYLDFNVDDEYYDCGHQREELNSLVVTFSHSDS